MNEKDVCMLWKARRSIEKFCLFLSLLQNYYDFVIFYGNIWPSSQCQMTIFLLPNFMCLCSCFTVNTRGEITQREFHSFIYTNKFFLQHCIITFDKGCMNIGHTKQLLMMKRPKYPFFQLNFIFFYFIHTCCGHRDDKKLYTTKNACVMIINLTTDNLTIKSIN